MPKTCRTDTFMSGRPVIAGAEDSCTLVVAAVVINPPRSRAFPKPDFCEYGCGWVLVGTYQRAGSGRSPRPNQSSVALSSRYGLVPVFGRLPCESRRTFADYFDQRPKAAPGWHFPPPSLLMLGLRPVWTTPKQEFCGFLHRSLDCIRLGTSVACLSDAVPGRPAGGGSGCGLGGSRLDHHLGAERADPRRRAEAWMGAAG